ncbi:MAG: response regulator [Desulfobacter sp.]|nr:response regulator [Desulfobacter sp.]
MNFASNALTPLGYEVHLAENGKIALAWIESRIEQKRPLPDLVVTDLIMPELGGKAFIQQAKTYVPGIKVIFVSGHTDHHIVHNGMLDPGVTFLQKPYSPNLLAEKIREVLSTSGPG